MKQELSQKERIEPVTKGFLVDSEYVTRTSLEEVLDSKNYVTKDYLEEVLDSKNYVTKDYLYDVFETYQKDMKNHIDALIENNKHQFQMLIEAFNRRFERIENHVGLEPWGSVKI